VLERVPGLKRKIFFWGCSFRSMEKENGTKFLPEQVSSSTAYRRREKREREYWKF
jgi:hypothetical protein